MRAIVCILPWLGHPLRPCEDWRTILKTRRRDALSVHVDCVRTVYTMASCSPKLQRPLQARDDHLEYARTRSQRASARLGVPDLNARAHLR